MIFRAIIEFDTHRPISADEQRKIEQQIRAFVRSLGPTDNVEPIRLVLDA